MASEQSAVPDTSFEDLFDCDTASDHSVLGRYDSVCWANAAIHVEWLCQAFGKQSLPPLSLSPPSSLPLAAFIWQAACAITPASGQFGVVRKCALRASTFAVKIMEHSKLTQTGSHMIPYEIRAHGPTTLLALHCGTDIPYLHIARKAFVQNGVHSN